eukprot:TRINITY_DN12086_c0_g1_i6.p1 TRINITY_DN12086_c0_g1~~TRINITY_DN12086_c0_g1_i6.p1  ORF type:complete len:264 (+),score=45.37 TRINITY_DN12086_c0_g1_i6:180-971(+)
MAHAVLSACAFLIEVCVVFPVEVASRGEQCEPDEELACTKGSSRQDKSAESKNSAQTQFSAIGGSWDSMGNNGMERVRSPELRDVVIPTDASQSHDAHNIVLMGFSGNASQPRLGSDAVNNFSFSNNEHHTVISPNGASRRLAYAVNPGQDNDASFMSAGSSTPQGGVCSPLNDVTEITTPTLAPLSPNMRGLDMSVSHRSNIAVLGGNGLLGGSVMSMASNQAIVSTQRRLRDPPTCHDASNYQNFSELQFDEEMSPGSSVA